MIIAFENDFEEVRIRKMGKRNSDEFFIFFYFLLLLVQEIFRLIG